MEFYSDQELTTDESSYEEYEPWSNDLQHTSVMRDPVDPPGMSHLHRQNAVQQCENGSSVWTETDGGNSDICNLADFSSEERIYRLNGIPVVKAKTLLRLRRVLTVT